MNVRNHSAVLFLSLGLLVLSACNDETSIQGQLRVEKAFSIRHNGEIQNLEPGLYPLRVKLAAEGGYNLSSLELELSIQGHTVRLSLPQSGFSAEKFQAQAGELAQDFDLGGEISSDIDYSEDGQEIDTLRAQGVFSRDSVQWATFDLSSQSVVHSKSADEMGLDVAN